MTKSKKITWIALGIIFISIIIGTCIYFFNRPHKQSESQAVVTILGEELNPEDVKFIEVDIKDANHPEVERQKLIEDPLEIEKFVDSANAAIVIGEAEIGELDATETANFTFFLDAEVVEVLTLVEVDTVGLLDEGWVEVDYQGRPSLYECYESSAVEEALLDISGSEMYELNRKKVDTEIIVVGHGIDVSQHQGVIDWAQVAMEDVEFAFVRIGNRNVVSGEIEEDATARYNLQEATKHGIPVGAYFFSAAVSEAEALEEAVFVANIIAGYPITYPVVYNCELFTEESSRQFTLGVSERSHLADVFLAEMEKQGYIGMFYASKYELEDSGLWATGMLSSKYRIWMAQYKENINPDTDHNKSDYLGDYQFWQYTDIGTVAGIDGAVDKNISYVGYSQIAEPKAPGTAPVVQPNLEVGTNMQEVNEQITAKEEVNVRSSMEQGNDSNIIGVLHNGEIVVRTGIGTNGWSRIAFNGGVGYVISNYVTTDTAYSTQQEGSQFKTVFASVNEQVTAKNVTNLRDMPSVEQPSKVVVELKKGDVATRIGIANEGWSKVEYQGQVLYCVSSYLEVVN